MVRKKDIIRLCEKHSDCEFLSFTNGTLIDEEFCDEMLKVKNFVPPSVWKDLKMLMISAEAREYMKKYGNIGKPNLFFQWIFRMMGNMLADLHIDEGVKKPDFYGIS